MRLLAPVLLVVCAPEGTQARVGGSGGHGSVGSESSCLRDGWACTGRFIEDVEFAHGSAFQQRQDCFAKCRATAGCGCVTWLKRKRAKCRLSSGSGAEDRDRPDLYGAHEMGVTCEEQWATCEHTSCTRRWIDEQGKYVITTHHRGTEAGFTRHRCSYDVASRSCACLCKYDTSAEKISWPGIFGRLGLGK